MTENAAPSAGSFTISTGKQAESKDSRRATLVVIDDNTLMRKLFVRCLEDSGFTVLEAGDGHTGLALIREFKPDMVLMDIMMPQTSGMDMIRTIRGDEVLAQTKVIAVTNLATPDDRKRITEAGFDGHIPKPIKPKEFPEIVRSHLLRERAAAAAS